VTTISAFSIHGQIVHASDGLGISDLRIVGLATVDSRDRVLTSDLSDESGRFTLPLAHHEVLALFRAISADGSQRWLEQREFEITAWNADSQVTTQRLPVRLAQVMADDLTPSLLLRVEFRTTRHIDLIASVRTVRGRAVAGIPVTIVPVGPSARPLASANTDASGEATLRIPVGARATPTNTDVRVRVIATRAGEELAATPVLFSPTAAQRIELVVHDDAVTTVSEFDAIAAALQPLLGTRAVSELGTDEVERFAADADVFPPHLAMFVHATRLAEHHSVPATTWYGLLRGGLPSSLPLLLVQSRERFARALGHAHRDGLIPGVRDVDQDIDARIVELRALTVRATLEPEAGGDRKVAQALATTTLSTRARQTFVERLVEHHGSLPSLWAALRTNSELSTNEIDTLEFTITAAALVHHHLPALEGLQALFAHREITSIRDLAAWDADRWMRFLDGRGAPDDIPGDTPAERVVAYARAITRIVEDIHPTATLRHRLERDRPAAAAGVAAFLRDNPTFSITSTIAARYVEANPAAAPPGQEGEQTIANLKTLQRLYQLAPRLQRYDVTRTLLEAGLTSAAEIVHRGADGFVDRYAPRLDGVHPHLDGRALAGTLFHNARVRHGATVALMTRHGAAFNDVSMLVLSSNLVGEEEPGTATLRDLFGSLDYCACEHCRSMYGPAAYLVDLLVLLESRPALAEDSSALDVLLLRRRDITGIELSCINTNTVLPYIDLVLEILEQIAVQEGALLQPRQTTWTAAELRLGAEHRIAHAYDGPAQAVFPWRLPFDLSTERMRAYLQQLGCTRLASMRALQRDAGGVLEPSRALVVAEALSTTAVELQLLSGGTAFAEAEVPGTPPDAGWGMSGHVTWTAELAGDVGELLTRSALSFDELQLVLALPFVDPNDVVHVQFDQPSCDLADAHVEGFTVSVADRVHRFVRLWRKTGMDPYALDRMLRVLRNQQTDNVLDFVCLERIVALFEVRDRLRASTDALLGLWAPLDTRSADSGPSPYHRLFQNRETTPEPDPAFATDSGADEIDTPVALGDEHHETIRAALGIGAADLELLITEVLPADPQLDLANLSVLYRHAWLARAMRLPVADLVRVLAFVPVDPFSPLAPAATLEFIDEVERIRRTDMSFELLDYVLRHQVSPEATFLPAPETFDGVLAGILEAAAAIDVTLAALTGEPADRVRAFLGTLTSTVAEVDEWLRLLALAPGAFSAEDEAFLVDGFALFTDNPDAAVAALAPLAGVPRFELVLELLLSHLRLVKRREALVSILASFAGVSAEAIVVLGDDVLHVAGEPILDVLLDGAFLAGETDGTTQMEALARLIKAAVTVTALQVPTVELDWYFDGGAPQALDLDALPLVPIADGTVHYEGWRRVAIGLELRASTTGDNPFRAAAVAGDLGAALDILAARTRWDREDLAFATGPGLLPSAASELADPHRLARLDGALALVPRTGVRLSTLAEWARQPPTQARADAALRALRSRYDEQHWAEVVTPIADRLRERQRDALVDFIVARGDFASAEEMYEHFLIDPLMNATTLTSRIRLAISAAQLFIQRVLMNMEQTDVVFPSITAERWAWMKNYRVWEANRKVFFYPENWVEPELRDDKSPFFTELEQHLGQAEITDAHVEKGLRDYLRKLHEVAHLQTVAIWRDTPEEGGEIVHVLSRTRGLPPKYFHRTRIDDRYWTPWRAVPVDIQGDQVTIAVYNRRLFVFWVEYREKQVGAPAGPAGGIDDAVQKTKKPTYRYHVRIGWTELRDEAWAPKKLTPESEGYWHSVVELTTSGFLVMAYRTESELRVDVLRRMEPAQSNPVHVPGLGLLGVPAGAAPNANRTFVRFVYDDCRDELDERLGEFVRRTDGDLGMGLDVGVEAQRHVSKAEDEELDVLYYHPTIPLAELLPTDDPYYAHVGLLSNLPTRYHVTVARQRPMYAGDTPLVFDDRNRSFYIAPVQVPVYSEPEGIAPGDPDRVTTVSTASGPSGEWSSYLESRPPSWDTVVGTERTSAPASMLAAPLPWSGRVPGALVVPSGLELAHPPETDALAVLGTTRAIDSAPATATLIRPPAGLDGAWILSRGWRVDPFHHPYTCTLLATLNRHGVEGLYTETGRQVASTTVVDVGGAGNVDYHPSSFVVPPDTLDDYDFTFGGAYSVYNWELFFHLPLLLAEKLRKEQRFEEAQRWYHFIFNPLAGVSEGVSGIERFWNIKEFFNNAQGGAFDVIRAILQDEGLDAPATIIKGFLDSVVAWVDDPFSPHAIARVRPGTYEKVVVRKYLDNLIDWADSLFRLDTIESINEATQIYLLAAAILGPRPRRLSAIDPPVRTYADLAFTFLFGGLTELEGYFVGLSASETVTIGPPAEAAPPAPSVWWYFCLPPNEQLLRYWEIVADRLFKIRNSQNIEGVTRSLALFEPPIDPALLVRARAAGIDIGAAIAGLNAPLPHYRYAGLLQRALDLCGEVRSLGAALLAALEKKDGERLMLLRSQHEIALFEAGRLIRESQMEEAARALEGLEKQRLVIEHRQRYYDSRQKHSPLEKGSMGLSGVATGFTIGAQAVRTLAGVMQLIPEIKAGAVAPFPVAVAEWGGRNLGASLEAAAGGLEIGATLSRYVADLTNTLAAYERRHDDWKFHGGQAKLELPQIAKQILAAQIRVAITEKELANHELQIEQSKAADEYMRTKFTNEQLYDWTIGQLSAAHFQAYRLAFDVAKKAERAMQFELGRDDLTFIEFGVWDSLKKGLLAGDLLGQALRRMDAAYVDHDRRQPELSRRFSLREIDANAILALQETGSCEFSLPEVLFDLDHPGHYFRRIKSVSVSLPATVGPQSSVGGRLTLLSDLIRLNEDTAPGYAQTDPPHEDARFAHGPGGVQSIATSRGLDDAGMFQLDFRDERYLPFEGAGVISHWRFELPPVRQFDYRAISDLEIHLQYTAREGSTALRNAATSAVEAAISTTIDTLNALGMFVLLSARSDFPTEWERFLRPHEGEQAEPLPLPIVLERFPYVARRRGIVVDAVELVFVGPPDAITLPSEGAPATVDGPTGMLDVELTAAGVHDLVHGAVGIGGGIELEEGGSTWDFRLGDGAVATPEVVDDLVLIVRYHTAS
jgi:hypothetical protein